MASAVAKRFFQGSEGLFVAHGKQVFDPKGEHFADARDEGAAAIICAALNSPVFIGERAEVRV